MGFIEATLAALLFPAFFVVVFFFLLYTDVVVILLWADTHFQFRMTANSNPFNVRILTHPYSGTQLSLMYSYSLLRICVFLSFFYAGNNDTMWNAETEHDEEAFIRNMYITAQQKSFIRIYIPTCEEDGTGAQGQPWYGDLGAERVKGSCSRAQHWLEPHPSDQKQPLSQCRND